MTGGVFDSRNFEQIHFKIAWSKNSFNLDLFLKNVFEWYHVKFLFIKKVVQGNLKKKSKNIHLLVVVFLCNTVGWESYMTPRIPVEVYRGDGGSRRESSLLRFGRLGVIYNSQPHGYVLFVAIQIRVKTRNLIIRLVHKS